MLVTAKRWSTRIALVGVLCLLGACATKPNASPPQSTEAAALADALTDVSVTLFQHVCMPYANNDSERQAWLRRHAFTETPSRNSPPALNERLWQPTAEGKTLPVVVTTRLGPVQCEVSNQVVDPSAALAKFKMVVERLATPLVVVKIREGTTANNKRMFAMYRVGVPGGASFIYAASAGPTSAPGLQTLLMTAGPAGAM